MRGTFEKHTQFRGPLSTSGIKRPYLSVICACARWPSITVISNRTKQRPYRTVWNASKCSRSRFWFINALMKLINALITRGFFTVDAWLWCVAERGCVAGVARVGTFC
jgi:hypothetical protein